MRPRGVMAPPVVIIFGGADGWREEYHGAGLALVERGVAALLLDGPGQGETRILGGLHLQPGIERAFAAAIRFLIADERVSDLVGRMGQQLGRVFRGPHGLSRTFGGRLLRQWWDVVAWRNPHSVSAFHPAHAGDGGHGGCRSGAFCA